MDCREKIINRDSTIDKLRHSRNVMHQTYAGMVIESNAREYKLQENYCKILKLKIELALRLKMTSLGAIGLSAVATTCMIAWPPITRMQYKNWSLKEVQYFGLSTLPC